MFAAIIALGLGLSAIPAQALVSDDHSLVEGAKLCTRYLPRHEREYGIPVHLLAAIASTESGRYHRALGLNLPWPWTINVEGKGYFFDSKQEAVAAVQQFHARGFRSIDVGCMQVNLHHHPYAFANLEQAFDPAYNVAYAARFHRQNFEKEGAWRKATADYHSRTPAFGEPYVRLVFGAWNRILNKIADARAGRPILNQVSAQTPFIRYHDTVGATAAAAVTAQAGKARVASYRAPRMRSISVTQDSTIERGVMVIRPARDETAAAASQEKAGDVFVTRVAASAALQEASGAADSSATQVVRVVEERTTGKRGQFQPSAHVVRVGDYAAASTAKASGNMFVFDN